MEKWIDSQKVLPKDDDVVLCKVKYCKYTQYLVLNWYK